MITGFNTDIEHEGVTYHVQTEDKGLETPLILSLVYNRGTILASKRVTYDDLLAAGFDEKALAERLQKQHKTICAAVRAGRIEELKLMTAKDSARQKAQRIETKPPVVKAEPITQQIVVSENNIYVTNPPLAPKIEPKIQINRAAPPAISSAPPSSPPTAAANPKTTANGAPPNFSVTGARKLADLIDQAKAQTENPAERVIQPIKTAAAPPEKIIPKPRQELVLPIKSRVYEGELITGNFEIIEEEPIIEAVQILTDFGKPEAPKTDKLQIEFMTETVFKGGDRKTVSIFVHRGGQNKGAPSAQIMVKVLGSSFRPLIFHAKTDSNGVATVHLQLPHFRSGRAAILVRAISGSEEAELRRVVAHG